MFVKPILFALLAACGINPNNATIESPPSEQPDKQPPDEPEEEEGQHFCCTDVDQEKVSGEGCGAIGKENINTCDAVLYCPDKWTKKDGKVVCK